MRIKTNKTIKAVLISASIITIIILTAIGVRVLNNKSNTLDDKLVKMIDSEIVECYDCPKLEKPFSFLPVNDTPVSPQDYKDSYDGIQNEIKRIEHAKAVQHTREEAEVKRLAMEAEKKRLADIEAERIRLAELEKTRLAKLEEKKLSQPKENKSQQVAVSRSQGYQANYEATYYTAFCPTGCIGTTASGYQVSNTIYYQGLRIVAAPPNIPFYTKLRISFANGDKMDAIVLDRGGDIQAGRLDILVTSRDEAYRLGRQQVKVEVIN